MAICIAAAAGLVVSAEKSIDNVDSLYMNIKPAIDGKINAEEWGEVTVQARTSKATIRSETGEGPDATAASGSFFHSNHEDGAHELSWDMWLRWDEQYYYLAVLVTDPDGHSLVDATGGNIWNGDVIQFRIDAEGPNASENKDSPWGSDVPNIAVGKANDGQVYIWEWVLVGDNEVPGSQYACVVEGNITTYEVAIPHEFIGGKGEDGFVYGMSLVLLNAAGPDGLYNSWLTWGDGICGPQDSDDRVGSNAVKLVKVDAIVIPEVVEEATEAPTAAPETQPAPAAVPEAPVAAPPGAAPTTGDAAYLFAIFALISFAGIAAGLKKAKR